MNDLLFQKIKEYVSIEDKDLTLLNDYFDVKKLQKGDYLHHEGDLIHYASFVKSGLFRTYVIDEQGVEHILQFAMAGWWTGDLGSFISGEPTTFYVEAIEDSEILRISKNSWDALMEKAPFYVDYHRKLLERGLVAIQHRLLDAYSVDAKRKYLHLLDSFPDILQRVPQYMIASYLGMSRETLSRVRKQLGNTK